MDKKARIEYLIITSCTLVSASLLYILLGIFIPNGTGKPPLLFFGFAGGIGFSSIMSSIILAVHFFSKKTLTFKIVAALLWPVTFICVVYAGIFTYIPYEIYNIVKIVKLNKTQQVSNN